MIYPCSNLSAEEFKIASLFTNTLTNVGLSDIGYEEVQKIGTTITNFQKLIFISQMFHRNNHIYYFLVSKIHPIL